MTCTHLLGPLVCDRKTTHDPRAVGGHTYTASSLPDGHDDTEAAAERAH